MIKKYILLPIILTVSIFFVSAGAEATIAPQIYFTDISLEKDSFKPGEAVKGAFSLWNYEELVMGDLAYSVQLFTNNEDGQANMLVDSKKDASPFTLKAGEKSIKNFNYVLPSVLPNGEMTLRIQLSTRKGEQLSWEDKTINIESQNGFLTLDNTWILKEGPYLEAECLSSEENEESLEEISADIPDEMIIGKDGKVDPGIGINYNPGDIPEASFDVFNNSSSDISAYYKIVVYERNFDSAIIGEEKSEPVLLKANEKKTININLFKMENPGSYLAEVKYYNESGNIISNSAFFRWVIAGEGAKILFVKPDKVSYLKGEAAKIEAEVVGPAGFCNSLTGEEILEVKLFNEKGELVGETSSNVDKNNQKLLLEAYFKKDVDNPGIEAKLIRNGEVLDSYTYQLNSSIDKPAQATSYILYTIILLAIIFIAVVVIVLAYYFITKSKNKTLPLLLVVITGLLGAFAFNASAAVEVSRGCRDTTVTLNSPLPSQTFSPGDTVRFRGRITMPQCVNAVKAQYLNFYIAENRDISIVDCKNRSIGVMPDCNNPYSSSNLSQCTRSLLVPGTWISGKCNTVSGIYEFFCSYMKFVDTSNISYKTHLLGSVQLPVSHEGVSRTFDYSFTIPEDWSGPVRFYISFYGRWGVSADAGGGYMIFLLDEGWWNVLYQPATIAESKPYVQPGSERTSKESYCPDPNEGVNPGEGKVNVEWVYKSDVDKNQSSYRIYVANDSAMTNIVKDFEVAQSGSSGSLNTASFKILKTPSSATNNNELGFNKSYYWAVKVKDADGKWSDMSQISTFLTPSHAWPAPNFSWSPGEPGVNMNTQFTNNSSYYEKCCAMGPCLPGEIPCNRLQGWTFQNGNPASSTSKNPIVKFLSEGTKTVKLQATDTDGYSCDLEKSVFVKAEIPGDHNPEAIIDCSPSSCEVFEGSPLVLNNNSTDLDGIENIALSKWYIGGDLKKECSHTPAMPPSTCNLSPGDYVGHGTYEAKLYVEDEEGNWDEATQEFKINEVAGPSNPPTALIDCSPSSCEVFEGDALVLNNQSTDPDGIENIKISKWYINGNLKQECNHNPSSLPSSCNMTPGNYVGVGTYTAKLYVEDIEGNWDEDTKQFTIKENINADFQCSLDNSTWSDCTGSEFKVLDLGDEVYLKDISTASQGASISFRMWAGSYQDNTSVGTFDNNDEVNTFFTVEKLGQIKIGLSVLDTNGKSGTIIKTLGSIPPPIWWPVSYEFSPITLFKTLFASIF